MGTTRRILSSVYRLSAIRRISGFRTVSDEAVLVLAKTIPIDILADEMRRIYLRRLEHPGRIAAIKAEERRTSMHKWQSRWESSLKGRWTFRLIPDVTLWMNNKHCELNYYVTQFLTGHGCFRKYLHRFGHDTSPICPNCVICCPRFRWPGETSLGPNRLMEELLNRRILWSQYSQRMAEVLIVLRRLEEQRRNLN